MKKYFLTGLLTLLPLAVTLWIFHAVVSFLIKPFIGIISPFTHLLPIASPQVVLVISRVLILLSFFVLVLLLGAAARKVFFTQLIRFSNRFLNKIPLVNKVYKTSQE